MLPILIAGAAVLGLIGLTAALLGGDAPKPGAEPPPIKPERETSTRRKKKPRRKRRRAAAKKASASGLGRRWRQQEAWKALVTPVEDPEPIRARPDANTPPLPLRLDAHAWLDRVEPGSVLDLSTVTEGLECGSTLGWHRDFGNVQCVLAPPNSLRPFRNDFRLTIQSTDDYQVVYLAKINQQQVPVFTVKGDAATFEGFFLFLAPSTRWARCNRVPKALNEDRGS